MEVQIPPPTHHPPAEANRGAVWLRFVLLRWAQFWGTLALGAITPSVEVRLTMRSEEKEVAADQHPLFLDLLKGLVLPALPGVVLNAVNVSAKTDLLLSGVWFACLFAVRSVWIPSFTRLIYRRRWTR